MSKSDHSFGTMWKFQARRSLAKRFEIMRFRTKGKPHCHGTVELAICTSGEGFVWVGQKAIPVCEGVMVRIPFGHTHYMQPLPSRVLEMVILYEAAPKEPK